MPHGAPDDLVNGADPVWLAGTGTIGVTRYKMQVELDSRGSPSPGAWRCVVD